MSGHSKWATIKHKKAKEDAKRGRLFTKIIRELTSAARSGGGNSETNPALRVAMDHAKECNMPKNNIDNAIKRGTGDLDGVNYEEINYEGYGPGGTAVLVETLTDNKKRCAAEIRHIFSKQGGSLGEAGCVSWMFHKKGMIIVPKEGVDEAKLMDIAIDAGAEDIQDVAEDNVFEIYTTPDSFEKVKKALTENKVKITISEVTMIPQSYVRITGKDAEHMLKLIEVLEESDDVQMVYANFDIPSSEMEMLAAGDV
ncbi:MAG TPA: YebC/PmpR family DNA-binding transcriptional regulator [bacterium]